MKNKQYWCSWLITVCFLMSGCRSNETDYLSNEKLAVSDIKQAFDLKNKYITMNNADSIATVIHPHAIYGHSNCWVQKASDVINNPPEDSLQYINIDVEHLNIDIVGSTGIVQGNGQFTGIYKLDTFNLNLCFVETYAYQKGKWMLVTRQAAKQ